MTDVPAEHACKMRRIVETHRAGHVEHARTGILEQRGSLVDPYLIQVIAERHALRALEGAAELARTHPAEMRDGRERYFLMQVLQHEVDRWPQRHHAFRTLAKN
jgi:hypothetical protein